MFKNMKLSLKIAAGFAAILLLSTVLGGFCVFSMKNAQIQSGKLSNEFVPVASLASEIERATSQAALAVRTYSLTEKSAFYDSAIADMEKAHKNFNEVNKLIEKYPGLSNIKDMSINAEAGLTEYENIVKGTKQLVDARLVRYQDVIKYGAEILADLEKLTKSDNISVVKVTHETISLIYDVRMAALRTQLFRDTSFFDKSLKNFDKVNKNIANIKSINNNSADTQIISRVIDTCEKYKAAMFDYNRMMTELLQLDKKRTAAVSKLQNEIIKMSTYCMNNTKSSAVTSSIGLTVTSSLMVIGLIASMIIGTVLAWLIVIGITKPINRIINGLNDSSEQVTSASGQLSSSSQQLAEGSAEQAASLEETSSTLEESASMIRQNTENTRQAALLAKKTKEAADKGNKEMQDMMVSMGELKKSSDQIAKIIKVIDDIAFQTNILALNAAVEAARAGEAGMGFAVVAEEVRNLAQRSAQAAKDTALIIESNIELSEKGVEVSSKVNESLVEIFDESQKVNELIDEIAAASQEQAQGIAQINKAISQMEQVVQHNAATAEESSAASQELSSQAMNMKDIVNSLVQLVNGVRAELNHSNYRALSARNNVIHNKSSVNLNKRVNSPKSNLISSRDKNTHVINPEEVIPLENDTQGF